MMGYGVSMLLIAAAAGYWVLTLAASQKNQLKKIGQFVGLVILAVSLVGAACKIYYLTTGGTGKAGIFCPWTGRSAPPAATK